MNPPLPPLIDLPPITALDGLANAMERKWGIGRLPRLVPPAMLARWEATLAACAGEFTPRAEGDAMMMRAWRGMDAAATAAGAEPLPPGLWEVPDPVCPGSVVVVCQDDEHAQAVRLRALHEGRGVVTYTLAEVASVMQAFRTPLVRDIERAWPSATVQPLPPRWPRGGDPVPDIAGIMAADAMEDAQ